MKIKTITTLLLFFLIFESVHACRCRPNVLSNEITISTEIFQGEVVNISRGEEGMAYTIKAEKVWKGDIAETIIIESGFGGGDCGVRFKQGKSYIVFSIDKRTSICRQNSEAGTTNDSLLLEYHFNEEFAENAFVNKQKMLNTYESDFLNAQLAKRLNKFDFTKLSVLFTLEKDVMTKKEWFDKYGLHNGPVVQIVQLNEEEKEKYGYDVILVTYSKMTVSKRMKKCILKRSKKLEDK